MSFLRRVLARGEGRGVLVGAPRHVFRREVEVSSPEVEVAAAALTPTRAPMIASRPPGPIRGPEVAPLEASPSVPTVDARVERFEQVERQIVREPHSTHVHVHVPAVAPPAEAVATPAPPHEIRRDVEHHHEHTTTERLETQREVVERVVVRTTAPQVVVPPPRRSVPAVAVERTPTAVPPAAPPPVHVSIGRIVLSAAPKPIEAERARSAVAPARSLADILAAKKGRS